MYSVVKKKYNSINQMLKPYFILSIQDEYLDEERMMLDRSPNETESNDGDLDELDSDNELEEDAANVTSDGERIIWPWMRKIHVAGVGK